MIGWILHCKTPGSFKFLGSYFNSKIKTEVDFTSTEITTVN